MTGQILVHPAAQANGCNGAATDSKAGDFTSDALHRGGHDRLGARGLVPVPTPKATRG